MCVKRKVLHLNKKSPCRYHQQGDAYNEYLKIEVGVLQNHVVCDYSNDCFVILIQPGEILVFCLYHKLQYHDKSIDLLLFLQSLLDRFCY